jgi:hypothetical protein
MNVRIDHSRHQSAVPEVDYLRSGGMRHRSSGFADALSFHQNLSGLNDASGFDVEKARGVQHNWMCPSLGRRLRKASSETDNGDAGEENKSRRHGRIPLAQMVNGNLKRVGLYMADS